MCSRISGATETVALLCVPAGHSVFEDRRGGFFVGARGGVEFVRDVELHLHLREKLFEQALDFAVLGGVRGLLQLFRDRLELGVARLDDFAEDPLRGCERRVAAATLS